MVETRVPLSVLYLVCVETADFSRTSHLRQAVGGHSTPNTESALFYVLERKTRPHSVCKQLEKTYGVPWHTRAVVREGGAPLNRDLAHWRGGGVSTERSFKRVSDPMCISSYYPFDTWPMALRTGHSLGLPQTRWLGDVWSSLSQEPPKQSMLFLSQHDEGDNNCLILDACFSCISPVGLTTKTSSSSLHVRGQLCCAPM